MLILESGLTITSLPPAPRPCTNFDQLAFLPPHLVGARVRRREGGRPYPAAAGNGPPAPATRSAGCPPCRVCRDTSVPPDLRCGRGRDASVRAAPGYRARPGYR